MSALIEQEPLRSRKVGDIAAASSGAALLLSEFNLDLCSEDGMALEAAAQHAGADLAALEQALHRLDDAGPADSAPHETNELISHIVKRYHDTHRRELPGLLKLARKVEAIHPDHPQVPHGLADMLQKLLGEIEVHMKKEELILFPAMRLHPDGALDTPIAQMRHDHDDHDEQLREIEIRTGRFSAPASACGSWRALYSGLAKFARDFAEHMRLENDVLFPRFEQNPQDSIACDEPNPSSAASGEEIRPASPAAAPGAPAIEAHDDVASASPDPLTGASLVPMLVGGLVLIVLAMCVALALA